MYSLRALLHQRVSILSFLHRIEINLIVVSARSTDTNNENMEMENVIPTIRTPSLTEITDRSSSSQAMLPNLDLLWALVVDINSPAFMLFSFDEDLVHTVLAAHGLNHSGLSFHSCFDLLCHHLLSGLCAGSMHADCCAIAGSVSPSKLAWEISTRLSSEFTTGTLPMTVARQLGMGLGYKKARGDVRPEKDSLFAILSSSARHEEDHSVPLPVLFSDLDKMKKPDLLILAAMHGLACCGSVDTVISLIVSHLSEGQCALNRSFGCESVQSDSISQSGDCTDLQVHILKTVVKTIQRKPLLKVLQAQNIVFDTSMSLSHLRRLLKIHTRALETGKQTVIDDAQLKELRKSWPQPVGKQLKNTLLRLFKEETSTDTLREITCACCAEACLLSSSCLRPVTKVNMELFKRSVDGEVPDSSDEELDNPYRPPSVFPEGPLQNALLDPAGVVEDGLGHTSLRFCRPCVLDIDRNKIPRLALVNDLYIGAVPEELQDLTAIEESMISLCRAKCWIVQLKEDKDKSDTVLPHAQKGMRGHVIIYPQKPERVARILPPSIADIVTPVCVLFIGAKPPSTAWLKEKAHPLVARADRVRRALIWLKQHNPLYRHIVINEEVLADIPVDGLLPYHIEHVQPNEAQEDLQSRYDTHPAVREAFASFQNSDSIPFENVVITDVEGHASSNELRAAAVRHVKGRGGGYIEVGHAEHPVNEFGNPALFPMIYPTLFPYGIGGCEDKRRVRAVSLQSHVKHLFSLSDRRFQEHPSFMFTTFNILQRRAVLLHTSIKVKRASFASVAEMFASVSPDAVHRVAERVANGDYVTAKDEDEKKVLQLMKSVNVVTSNVPGSSASKVLMRNEMRGMMMELGLPSFFITINPADIYNPIVKLLGGSDIDIDNMPPLAVPQFREQAFLVAKNPTVAAKFFNLYMKAFIKTILGFDSKDRELTGGILGLVKGYYGCVEAQGRGTLHCHMLIWLEGGLNPNEIRAKIAEDGDVQFRDRLLAFLDDTIATSIPIDPDENLSVASSRHHPCTVRGLNGSVHSDTPDIDEAKDLHNIVLACQQHGHTRTCYKYCKDNEQKECRFGLDEKNYEPVSSFNYETGELTLRCLDGLVNNFNETIIQAIRCNMDIKFIGSGPGAKAILYYITDYISKSQLKTHVAYAALKLAVQKLGEYDPIEDLVTVRAKKLLHKCANAMISHQELSAQQVSSFLNGFEDHFTSHTFRKLYWTSFESFLNKESPSPECYTRDSGDPVRAVPDTNETENNAVSHDDLIEDSDSEDDVSSDEEEEEETSSLPLQDAPLLSDEVGIEVDDAGVLVQKSSYVMDYIHRGPLFKDVNLWEFNTQIDKQRKKRQKANHAPVDIYLNMAEDDSSSSNANSDEDESTMNEDTNSSQNESTSELLASVKRIRPKCDFLEEHDDFHSHYQMVRSPLLKFVNVPTGPSIPRRDKDYCSARHARLMLMFFKPWRHATDLRAVGQSWSTAFAEFSTSDLHTEHVSQIIGNMQILHECKDSRDDHFNNRRNRHRNLISGDLVGHGRIAIDDELNDHEDDVNLLDHFEAIEACHSIHSTRNEHNIQECLLHAQEHNLFDSSVAVHTREGSEEWAHLVLSDDKTCEMEWQTAYDKRRDNWKKLTAKNTLPETIANANSGDSHLQDGSAFREAWNVPAESSNTATARIAQDHPAEDDERDVNIDTVIKKWELNSEQERAFRLVATKSMGPAGNSLRLYIGGSAGTGKSRVLNVLRDFFEQRNQARRFRVCCYMGIAARNVGGMTLHAALSMNDRSKNKSSEKSNSALMAMWEGVDFLFIDEVSMISCRFLCEISRALSLAKGNSAAFGGINLVLAGDFAQLPPVADKSLYGRIDTKENATKESGQNTVFGKLLWLSIQRVVMLQQQFRQSGDENIDFVHLLQRLRLGRCSEADYQVLSSRVLQNCNVDLAEGKWRSAPTIVADNACKDALNKRCAIRFAQEHNRNLHWYYPIDRHRGREVTDIPLRDHLRCLTSNITHQRLGQLPLCLGMPVLVSQNFDVEGGIVNGSPGTVKKIRYYIDDAGDRHLTSCVVNIPSASSQTMPGLPMYDMPILSDVTSLKFQHPYTKRTCAIRRTQVPIVPAFAMTAHRAQGQSLSNVIVDLQSCHGTESPYVMISRVRSLEGLVILRPFDKGKVTCRQSEDARRETKHLAILELQTTAFTGNVDEARVALSSLAELGVDIRATTPPPLSTTTQYEDRIKLLDRLQAEYVPSLDPQHRQHNVRIKKRPIPLLLGENRHRGMSIMLVL